MPLSTTCAFSVEHALDEAPEQKTPENQSSEDQ
jgi:hypothetical protein